MRKTPACAALIGLSLFGCSHNDTHSTAPAPLRPINVVTLAEPSDAMQIRFSGVVEAQQQAQLSFKVAGRVEALAVKVGDWVEAGQLLARLEAHDYALTVEELEARLSEAEATHQLAAAELKRVEQAIRDNAMADVNLDRARTGKARAEAAVAVLKVNLEKARDGVRYTELRAPFAGQVGQRYVESHELISEGQPVLSLHTPDALQVVVDLPQNQLSAVAEGQQASVSWHGSDAALNSIATELASQPHPLKRTYSATFELTDTQPSLHPGKTVQVQWQAASASPGFCVPESAVISEQGMSQVVRVSVGQAQRIPVSIVSQSNDQLCVQGSLFANDRIVVAGAHYLQTGDAIGTIREVTR
ncbi:efflux RND transporter periplasmic adaptor subunit [Marinobacter hydrocarbonoclasticus]|nr:efflux RND transporter periplasmic adaptor subunit [Marinobacter nauticus]